MSHTLNGLFSSWVALVIAVMHVELCLAGKIYFADGTMRRDQMVSDKMFPKYFSLRTA